MVIATGWTWLRFMRRQRVLSRRTDRDQKFLTVHQAWPLLKFLRLETLWLSHLKEIQESQDCSVSRWIALEIKKKSP